MTNKRFGSWPSYNGKKVLLDGDPGQVIFRHGSSATDLRLKVWTQQALTDATGAGTFTLPSGYFATVNSVNATVVRDTKDVALATFVAVRTISLTTVTVQCFEGSLIVTLLLGGNQTIELPTAQILVHLTVFGTGP